MPKRCFLEICESPYQYKNKSLRMKKSFTAPDYKSGTILTDDVFTYVEFYFSSHKKAMKYRNPQSKSVYGNEKKYHYMFYWKQAMTFYQASKVLPINSVPLVAYYSMLNAVKAFLAYRSDFIEDFVVDFSQHGLFEATDNTGNDLSTIPVARRVRGVFPLFGKIIDPNFETVWQNGKSHSIALKKLLYNLAFIHRAYITTYATSRGVNPQELFIPLARGKAPRYCKGNDSCLYLVLDIDKQFFSPSATSIPTSYTSTISPKFCVSDCNGFVLRSASGAKRNTTDSLSAEFKNLNDDLRQEFQYIHSDDRLWYIKRSKMSNDDVLNLNSMLISMAAMHRISEIVRYKPEQLAHLMDSKENWLIHEFITLALDQFIDEIASEITGQDIMGTGVKR